MYDDTKIHLRNLITSNPITLQFISLALHCYLLFVCFLTFIFSLNSLSSLSHVLLAGTGMHCSTFLGMEFHWSPVVLLSDLRVALRGTVRNGKEVVVGMEGELGDNTCECLSRQLRVGRAN